MLAGIASASVQGRVVLGSRAGARVRRLGREPDIEAVTPRGPRQAHLEGLDLHANVWVSAHDMRLIATVHDPRVIRQILPHLGLARSGQSPGPAQPERSAAP